MDGAEAGLWLTDMGGRRGLDWAGVMPMGGRRWPGLSSTSIDAVWLWAPADDIYDALDALACCSFSLDVSMLACMSPSPVPSPPAPSRKRPRGLWRQHQARAHEPSPAFPWPNGELLSHDRIAQFLRASSLSASAAAGPSRSPSSAPSRAVSPSASQSHSASAHLRSPSAASSHTDLAAPHEVYHEDDDEVDDRRSDSSASSKRRRLSPHHSDLSLSPTSGHGSSTPLSDHLLYNAALRPLNSPPKLAIAAMSPQSLSRATSTSTASDASSKGKAVHSADFEDWENLKELFARAAERYDGASSPGPDRAQSQLAPPPAADDIPEAIPLLRAVIRECHRFLIDHPDPSVVYADAHANRPSRSPDAITPTDERLVRDWTDADSAGSPHWHARRRTTTAPSPRYVPVPVAHSAYQLDRLLTRVHRHTELPTAFHAIFGITLFLMGNLVAQDPSIVLPGEPDAPSTYWLAALDVFETGENLPSRVGGNNLDTPEDWRMAIVWGRTLVCLADEKVRQKMAASASWARDGRRGRVYIAVGIYFVLQTEAKRSGGGAVVSMLGCGGLGRAQGSKNDRK